MALKYGVVQGRLMPQVGDFIQNFPDDWREEFRIAKRVGASHIEWIDGAPNVAIGNSILDKTIGESLDVPISGICLDWMSTVRHRTKSDRIADSLMIIFSCDDAVEYGIHRIVVPFLESASLEMTRQLDDGLYEGVMQEIESCLKDVPQVVLSIETDLDVEPMLKLVERFKKYENFAVTFDTGNLTRLGFNLHQHVDAYIDRIDGVHIKDCIKGGMTVPLGTGDADLTVLKRLRDVEFTTFQTARNPGLSPEDVFRYNVGVVERILKS